MKIKLRNTKRGFMLYYAAIVSSVLVIISIGIADLFYKEILLSYFVRESGVAFYAADTGAECSLFADFTHSETSPFATTIGGGPRTISCAGGVWTVQYDPITPSGCGGNGLDKVDGTFNFTINAIAQNYCSTVLVKKQCVTKVLGDPSSNELFTSIESSGHNVACSSITNRTVERTIKVTY